MARKVYVTQDQLNEILNGSYLQDPSSDGNLGDGWSGEITTNPLVGGEPVTTDEFAKDLPHNGWFMGRYSYRRGTTPAAGALTMEEKKTINEIAASAKNKTNVVSGPLADKLKLVLQNCTNENWRKRITKLLSGASENYLSNFLSEIKSGKVDQKMLAALGGKDLIDWMTRCITNRQKMDADDKKIKHDMGMENVYQKPGGMKQSGNGQAHTEKSGTITYLGQ